MPVSELDIADFLVVAQQCPVLDVRSPLEYTHAHLPGAASLPLFSNEERRIVGTAYKQESREKAIKLGMEFFGHKMVPLVEQAEQIANGYKNGTREVAVHCWRGGKRSASVAWLLDVYGFKVHLLKGGYKAYRHHVLQVLSQHHNLKVLSGYTGSNKTGLLQKMAETLPVIDLEKLARHKGSAFGNLNQEAQPGQEHFENLLATELQRCAQMYPGQTIWVEGESQRLGSVNIPLDFFKCMRSSPMLFVDIPFEKRLDFIVQEYGKYDKEKLVNAIIRIKKKLGGLETKNAIHHLLEEDVRSCFSVLLKYYDKLYLKTTEHNEFKTRPVKHVSLDGVSAMDNLNKLFANG